MLRRLIALLLTVYAIAFAFGALTAVRWPSIVMVLGWVVSDRGDSGLGGVNWREVGIAHGAAYLIAALGYYASGAMLAARKGGAVAWYLLALTASVPAAFLVEFDAGWWSNPSAGEGAMAGLMAGSVLLLGAVWELRRRPLEYLDIEVTPESLAHPQVAAAVAAHQAALLPAAALPEPVALPAKPKKKHPPVFVPDIVVRRQRALFIAQAKRRKAAREAAYARRASWDDEEDDDEAA